jgi:hypothetical protein
MVQQLESEENIRVLLIVVLLKISLALSTLC